MNGRFRRWVWPVADPDGMRCEPVFGEDGEVIAVARVSADLDARGRDALRQVVEAARRQAERESAPDPGRAERQQAALERIRERGRRWRAEAAAARRRRCRLALASAVVLVAVAGVFGLAREWPWWLSLPLVVAGFVLGAGCVVEALGVLLRRVGRVLLEYTDAAVGER